jgi:integrase
MEAAAEKETPVTKTGKGWMIRLRVGGSKRERFYLQCRREPEAVARYARMKALAQLLVAKGHSAGAPLILRKLAEQTTEAAFTKGEERAFKIANEPPPVKPAPAALANTWGELATLWISGELHNLFRNKVDPLAESTAEAHRDRLNRLRKTIGDVQLSSFTEEHANLALRALPAKQKWATRKQYELLIFRVLKLAVNPCKLIKSHPLPEGWVTKNKERPAMSWLYPAEDAQLMACIEVPFEFRLAYGFLAREGMRLGELLRVVWSDIDWRLGSIKLDKNKTNVPRVWRMSAGVVRALRYVWEEQGKPKTGKVFTCWAVPKDAAPLFRAHLKTAGVDRPELFEHSAERRQIRLHDLRATFITVALMLHYPEVWIMDRTGHKRSNQVHEYRRAARFAEESELGALLPLDVALGLKRTPGDYEGPDGIGGGSGSRVGHHMGQSGGNGMETAGSERLEDPSLTRGNAQEAPKTRGKRKGQSGKKQAGPGQLGGLGQDQALAEALKLIAAGKWQSLVTLASSMAREDA